MPPLFTPRLVLLPLSRAMLEQRLMRPSFDLRCETPQGALDVHFPPQWPGDPLPLYPALLAGLPPDQDELRLTFAVVTRAAPEAIGQIGTHAPPDDTGAVEIGYGLSPSARGRGYATEAVGALVQHLHGQERIRTVTAQTALGNRASERVLEKLGFVQTGLGWSPEDGDLTLWAH
ncbi:GNAT family N-acetyltransferase [Deinococcus koreensis]|uniref:N-acetyltransferase n=1 Tax=Deinococcus koreensis TaxID=2054903 RepID=A0A2K3UWU4_9DEIO|nr:GNAT family N-acetyltransferase [Deinococcus koreensis]PNY80999.1 N-acetyltransferase [Deinococcus koreensis]